VENINSKRQDSDRCVVKLDWTRSDGAVGYNVRYGIAKDKLYHIYQVLGANTLAINSLNSFQKYYFTIDAFNEKGITKGGKIVEIK
jgi:xylan 1,4-beta-xylosidase